ncbi:zinc-binding dehydrogenase [Virgibacillus sp. W0181]|uniref:zinc-binding dehydrogenase n=1 Tax=Virgibacillus sp. W0181 TaxID=3391581 RepID=UPI003F44A724
MKAFVYERGEFLVKDVGEPQAGAGEVVIRMRVAGLNHRDLFAHNQRGTGAETLAIGSDGAGVVESVGEGVNRFQTGDEVMINPSLGWYNNAAAQPDDYGLFDGTIAEKVVINVEQLERKPAYLTWEEAGVLTLSALTGYRAMFTKGQLKKGETVFIPGAGSGVATYLIPFAKKQGARVIVTSRSPEKRQAAKQIGADVVLDTASDWVEALKNETIDLVIDSVGQATFNRSLKVLKKGGKMVIFGSSTDDVSELNLREFFYGQYQLLGSTMGSQEELHEMLAFMKDSQLHPVVDRTFTLNEAKEALTYLEDGKQFGKIAIDLKID